MRREETGEKKWWIYLLEQQAKAMRKNWDQVEQSWKLEQTMSQADLVKQLVHFFSVGATLVVTKEEMEDNLCRDYVGGALGRRLPPFLEI